MNREEQLKADIADQRPDWTEERPPTATFGNTLETLKKGLGTDGKGLDALAQKLLDLINANVTQAVVALAKYGWVLVAQQELDEERAAIREKIAAAGKVRANVKALPLVTAIEAVLEVAMSELNRGYDPETFEPTRRTLNSLAPLLKKVKDALK
jgi:hypothetical protein